VRRLAPQRVVFALPLVQRHHLLDLRWEKGESRWSRRRCSNEVALFTCGYNDLRLGRQGASEVLAEMCVSEAVCRVQDHLGPFPKTQMGCPSVNRPIEGRQTPRAWYSHVEWRMERKAATRHSHSAQTI
jgi:hypothetical protein